MKAYLYFKQFSSAINYNTFLRNGLAYSIIPSMTSKKGLSDIEGLLYFDQLTVFFTCKEECFFRIDQAYSTRASTLFYTYLQNFFDNDIAYLTRAS
jgi:hypothetical protein